MRRDWNERFYDLIFWFYRLTGVPMIVNVDCDAPGYRSLRTAEDLISVFAVRRVDAIFVDDFLLLKKQQAHTDCGQCPVRSRQDAEVSL